MPALLFEGFMGIIHMIEYEVKDKLRGSTTDNGSNFLKCFRERDASSSLPNYDDLIDEEFEEHLLEEEADEDMFYFDIGRVAVRSLVRDRLISISIKKNFDRFDRFD
ncbi:hypothetical protein OUZ56_033590 [Daphnia magna]|uniref:Uncharacterized protein n=1 Tax=Daphnia magna TaxID=35525 RepID=A0ABR0BAW6_9CRUS|nr:hypothetical protein OUZ56_033590 [Daphnia magna]